MDNDSFPQSSANPVLRPIANSPTSSHWDSEVRLLVWLATCVSILSFLFYYQRGEILLYGDAVAHINIARRVFDSKTPGLLQLGTVWLPLPHLLMIPFLISNEMWRRGVGGSIPSMVAYVVGVVGMFRLVRTSFSGDAEPIAAARVAAWTAAVVYAANPNLIYMQATAMGESLYLALFVWSVVYFSEFVRGNAEALTKCGLCLAGACFTRYDGWFLAPAMAAAVLIVLFLRSKSRDDKTSSIVRIQVLKFILIAAAAPAVWLAYNGLVYRNPLEFENGPYSAKAIERRTQNSGNLGHPGSGNLMVAGMYFMKAAETNVAQNRWLQRLWLLLGIPLLVVIGRDFFSPRRDSENRIAEACPPLLFLLVPIPFYALSIAYGAVPIFVPAWWPFTHYNVRYGLQLLPAFAAALAVVVYLAVYLALFAERLNRKLRLAVSVAVFALVAASYGFIWHAGPVCLNEAQINMRSRNQIEKQLADWLQHLPPDSTLLMYLGDHVGALQQAGIPLRRVINEGNHRVWKQPSDSDGLWERALANPAVYADCLVATEGDPVWQSAREHHLRELVEIHVAGQAHAALYSTR
jgi:hypothetical protein